MDSSNDPLTYCLPSLANAEPKEEMDVRSSISRRTLDETNSVLLAFQRGDVDFDMANFTIHALYSAVFPFLIPSAHEAMLLVVKEFASDAKARKRSASALVTDETW